MNCESEYGCIDIIWIHTSAMMYLEWVEIIDYLIL